jgi:hypothetical protein
VAVAIDRHPGHSPHGASAGNSLAHFGQDRPWDIVVVTPNEMAPDSGEGQPGGSGSSEAHAAFEARETRPQPDRGRHKEFENLDLLVTMNPM